MIKLVIIYDPTQNPPLQMHDGAHTNPALVCGLLSQIITALSMEAVPNSSGLIVPAITLPKTVKN